MRTHLHTILLLAVVAGTTFAWREPMGYGHEISSGDLAHWGFSTYGLVGHIEVLIRIFAFYFLSSLIPDLLIVNAGLLISPRVLTNQMELEFSGCHSPEFSQLSMKLGNGYLNCFLLNPTFHN